MEGLKVAISQVNLSTIAQLNLLTPLWLAWAVHLLLQINHSGRKLGGTWYEFVEGECDEVCVCVGSIVSRMCFVVEHSSKVLCLHRAIPLCNFVYVYLIHGHGAILYDEKYDFQKHDTQARRCVFVCVCVYLYTETCTVFRPISEAAGFQGLLWVSEWSRYKSQETAGKNSTHTWWLLLFVVKWLFTDLDDFLSPERRAKGLFLHGTSASCVFQISVTVSPIILCERMLSCGSLLFLCHVTAEWMAVFMIVTLQAFRCHGFGLCWPLVAVVGHYRLCIGISCVLWWPRLLVDLTCVSLCNLI